MVLLVDEIDKADQEFEALLLELLSDFQVSIPELGTVHAASHPLVILTSNAARELTEALKRRCLFLTLDYPTTERERDILLEHVPELPQGIAMRIAEVAAKIRELDLRKPPAIPRRSTGRTPCSSSAPNRSTRACSARRSRWCSSTAPTSTSSLSVPPPLLGEPATRAGSR